MYLPCRFGSSKLIVYFHGNAEDIGLSLELLAYVRDQMRVNVLSVEYPGYGIYKGSPSTSRIMNDALIVYDYLTVSLGIQ
jgi:hypothetical protein